MKNKPQKNIKIIPLGQNCMPRTILTRWGIKQKKIFGELTYPFDLAVFETREITHSIKTDFKEFLYDLNYRPEKKIWVKEPDCIEFVHDKFYGINDKEKLVNKYLERINNFRQTIQEQNPIIFVQILGDCSDIENLYEILSQIREDKPFRLSIIDTANITSDFDKADILKISFPSEEYKKNWWKKKYYNSVEGKIFESTIASFVQKIVKEI